MKKRIIGFVTALVTAAMVVNVPLNILAAETGTYGELEYEVTDDGTVTITDCNSSATSVDVPAEIDGMPVTAIGNNAFYGCNSLTSISLPDSVTSIGNNAFWSCDSLTSISLPGSLTSIGHHAFYGCNSLTSISLPDSVTSIGNNAFHNCGNLTSINIPDGVTSIGKMAFSDCSSLTSINIPYGVTSIAGWAFRHCDSLTSINIPDGVTSIGDVAFYSCSSLTSISIPADVTSIGNSAFYSCGSLTDVYYGGTEEQWNAVSIGNRNENLTNANIHFNSSGTVDQSDFNADIYRADYMINGNMSAAMESAYVDLATPCEELYRAARECGMDTASAAWSGLMDTLNSVDKPSSILDYAFEEKDMYSAILMSTFESSVDYDVVSNINNDITKNTAGLISFVSSEMKNKYNLDVLNSDEYKKMTTGQKEEMYNSIKDKFEKDHQLASGLGDIANGFRTIMKYADGFESLCEKMTSYYHISMLGDSMRDVMNEMYDNCPSDNTALRAALRDCIDAVDYGKEDLLAKVALNTFLAEGKEVARVGIDKLWGGVKSAFEKAHPAVIVLKSAYEAGKYISDVAFNADDIQEKYCKVIAASEVSNLVHSTYYKVKSEYINSKTEQNAKKYNSAVDVVISAYMTDCDYAAEYAKSIDSALAGKLSALLGDDTMENFIKSVQNLKSSASEFGESIPISWINSLEVTLPDIYAKYKHIVDDYNNEWAKRYNIACPVDVYIYDKDGYLVGSVVDNVPFCSSDANITIGVDDDEKVVYTYGSEEYTFIYEGNDTGTMDIAVTEYGDISSEREVNFNRLELSDGVRYTSYDNGKSGETDAYVITDETDNAIMPDYDSQQENSTYTASIKQGYFIKTADTEQSVCVGEALEIAAYIPIGYEFAGWTSDHGDDIFNDVGSVETKVYMPEDDITITAKLVPNPTMSFANVTSDSVVVKANGIDDAPDSIVIFAAYNSDGTLKNVYLKDFASEAEFTELELENCIIKAMLWDVETMTPQAISTEGVVQDGFLHNEI